ncbi:hypothetical protein SETIT_7G160900v2 [Setaria italica]|uniref:Uncharacterized protein n=1 Tax=Setaria italica TaxID=4555 RepID=A0A368RW57_SETIT|nr:protein trichome birefringence-like 2 [Setaria italica]RCV34457.1 hypothetical protein SETIT_7G160900v2 [Setaria italica]
MPGWKKAWLSMLDRAGGGGSGSSGSLQVHVQGLHSPSSSSSSLASYKRGGKYGVGHVSSKAVVVGCFSAVLALALGFFYVSVTSGPAAGDSFPSPAAASSSSSSSSGILLSWLSSNTSTTSPRKSLLPHPPIIPPAVTAGGAADDDQSDARNATAASRRVQSSAVGHSSASASEVGSGQATSVSGQTANAQGPPLQGAGNATVGSDTEPAGNGTREEEPQVETATAMLRWRRTETDGASSSNNSVVGAPGQIARNTDVATGNSIDAGTSSREEVTENAAVDNVQSSARQGALPSWPEWKVDRHRPRRVVRRRHPRRRKEVVLPAQDLVAEQSDGETAGAKANMAVGPGNDMAGVNTSMVVGPGNGGVVAGANASMGVAGAGNTRIVWTSGVQDLVSFARCDVFNGRWVRDESYGFYPPKSCALIDDDFNCHKNGRPDSDYLKWRWQPQGCDIPRLNATGFLERLRGQRIIFVGDSLNRNMWESLVCILRHGVRDKRNVYEASGKNQFKTRGYYSFRFTEYNCSVDFIRSIFLVKEMIREGINGTEDAKLKLDELDATTPAYQTADIVVFNTGHWWTHYKTSRGLNYYQEGNHVYRSLEVLDAYKRALTTWARWVDKNIDSRRTQVVFRGYSLSHFRGGQWNSGGRCHRETEPIFNQTYLTEYPEKMVIVEQVLRQMKTPVIYLNISTLTDYRKDGHPSVYRTWYETEEERMAAVKKQDCSHWCLPGVPDTWNELLYASLLQAGKGSWKL